MATKNSETWLKFLLIVLGLVLIAFTLYAILSLPETSSDKRKQSSMVDKLFRSRRAAEGECLWVLIANEDPKTLTSPNYPENYPSNCDCQWLLTTPVQNKTISIKIDTMAIEPDKECRLDYLQVYLGSGSSSPSLGPFCGNVNDRIVDTNSSTLLLVFHSDVAYEDAGFSITYYLNSESGADCRALLAEDSGFLSSPGFPGNYPDNAECSTLIEVDEGRKIVLVFDSVDMEYGDDCTFDYVQVFDGDSRNSTVLGRICQQSDARNFESTSNVLRVHFHSDDSVSKKGFRARYSSVDARNTPIGDCLWNSGESNGTVTSPNYPENYPSFANCSLWIVAPTERYRILITFDALLLEMESNCSYDFVRVAEERRPEESRTLGRFCGRLSEPKRLVSSGHEIQIEFQSDDFVEFLGFKLRYEFLKVEGEKENSETTDDPDSSHEVFGFSVRPQNATLTVGSSHWLHCSTDHPNAKIRWLKGELFLAGDYPMPGLKLLPNDTLWIESMARHLAGLYSCVAVSPEGVITAKVGLSLDGKRDELPCNLEFRKTPVDSDLEEGAFAHLECLATHPDAQVSWTKDGSPIPQSDRVTVLKNGYVFVDNVRTEDAGVYVCTARNPESGCTRAASARLRVVERTKIEDVCGKAKIEAAAKNSSRNEHSKILGGYDAQKGAYPWQVMLWEPKRQSFCGATLLNERWIATAAHCLVNDHNIRQGTIRIRLGKHDRERIEDRELETSIADSSSAVVLHPRFDPFTFDNDLALIRLRHRISFTDHVLPVCLGDRNLTEFLLAGETGDAPRMGTVTGWGLLKEKGPSPRFLQEIELPVVDQNVCKRSTHLSVTRNMFCAGYSQEIIGDACQGDSGGPFMMRHEGRWYMVGIVSWGEGCGTIKKYGFYTRISNHLSWIRGITKS